MNNFALFEMQVCLNHPNAKKRWDDSVIEFSKVGINNVLRFSALPDIGPHESFNNSVRAIVKAFYQGNSNTLLFLEDDIFFRTTDHLNAALSELPTDWDILYFGANLIQKDFKKPEKYSAHLHRVFNAWTTHCFAIKRNVAEFIIANQPGASERMFDNWLSDNLHIFNAFVINPMIAWQKPGKSLIWQSEINYSDIFQQSENILNI